MRRFGEDRCLQIVSSLTFTTLLAVLLILARPQQGPELLKLRKIAQRADEALNLSLKCLQESEAT